MDGRATCTRCTGTLRGAGEQLCPACRAPHCQACAALLGACGAAGCAGRFPPGPLPPLGALARSSPAWPEAERVEGAVVVLLPGPRAARERTEAALAVGELLGGGPEEGQRRLASGHPEALLRTREPGAAEGVAARLAAVGLPACVLAAAEVARPLRPFEVTSLSPGPPWRLRGGSGEERQVPPDLPRLVVAADLVEVRRRVRGGEPARAATERRLVEPLGLLTLGAPGAPIVLRARAVRGLAGLPAAAPLARRLALVLAQLAAAPGRGLTLEGTRAPSLLVPRPGAAPPPGEEGEEVRDNLPALLLADRLLEGAWRAGRLPGDLPAIAEVAW